MHLGSSPNRLHLVDKENKEEMCTNISLSKTLCVFSNNLGAVLIVWRPYIKHSLNISSRSSILLFVDHTFEQ